MRTPGMTMTTMDTAGTTITGMGTITTMTTPTICVERARKASSSPWR